MISLEEALDLCRPDAGYREDYLVCLYHYAAMLPKNSTIIEVGCYRGLSTLMLACGAPQGSHIYTIDPIFKTGSLTYQDVNGPITMSSNLCDVRDFWGKAGVNDRITVISTSSQEALECWDKGEIDLLFVDGAHSTEAVIQDCNWLDLMKPNALAAFDDWIESVSRGVMWALIGRPEFKFLHFSTDPPEGDMVLTLLRREPSVKTYLRR